VTIKVKKVLTSM